MNIKEKTGEEVVICLIGNKLDLGREEEMAVDKKEIENFAKAHNVKYFLTSAKDNINVKEAFIYLA